MTLHDSDMDTRVVHQNPHFDQEQLLTFWNARSDAKDCKIYHSLPIATKVNGEKNCQYSEERNK